MRRTVTLFFFAVLGVLVSGCTIKSKWTIYDEKSVVWDTYRGWMETYFVEIEDSVHDRRYYPFTRQVTLSPKGAEPWVHFSGWDFQGDGWDEIWFCGYPDPRNGCNAFYIRRLGNRIERRWMPNESERSKLKPFSEQEIAFVETQLNMAVEGIRRPEFLVDTLESFRAKLR